MPHSSVCISKDHAISYKMHFVILRHLSVSHLFWIKERKVSDQMNKLVFIKQRYWKPY
jgi:hypothetical protein